MSVGGGHPGKFPAKILAVAGDLLTLKASSAEDIEYLVPFENEAVTVEITPGHPDDGKPDSGPEAASAS